MHIDVQTEATPHGAGEARRALAVLEHFMPARPFATLCLLVSELVANGPHHMRDAGDSMQVIVDDSRAQGRVRAEVRDLQYASAARPRTQAEDERSGWDVVLLDEMSDRWGVLADRAGDVWFEIEYVRPSPPL